jgi:uncharacterized protein YukE
MADGFQVDPQSLRQGAAGLYDAAQQLSDAWQRFTATVSGMGPLFGNDPIGGLIGAGYEAAQGIADQSLGSVMQAFVDFGTGLGQMADRYDGTEQVNSDHLQSLHRMLG